MDFMNSSLKLGNINSSLVNSSLVNSSLGNSSLGNSSLGNSSLGNSTEDTCSSEAAWLIFPVTYLVLYTLGLTLSSIAFGLGLILSHDSKVFTKYRPVWSKSLLDSLHRLKQLSKTLVSGDNVLSQVLISVTLVCNLVYMALGFQRAYRPGMRCFSSLAEVPDLAVEVIISPILIIFFVIRLLASDNLVLFWLKIHTIVDVVTLPNIFISVSLGHDWLDMKTLRFVWLTQFTDVLRFVPIIHSQDVIDTVAIGVHLVALWLGATGLVHLLETTGDPWKDFNNQQSNTFLEYAYFIVVTMSTVGYGDYFAMTDIGRAFMTLFIIAGIAFFAFALPSLVDLVIDYYNRTQWSKFDTTRVPRHVLVCGHITKTTVSDFLKDFLHKDRGDSKTHVLFMHTERPGPKLRKVLRSFYTRVQYVMGSVLRAKDLAKARLDECKAVFILAEKHCKDPETEDQENLLRLVSIKNTAKDIPVTIQVLLSSSKEKVQYIPRTSKDKVICLTELKLGLLAQSCLCPGLSTLVGNFFYASEELKEVNDWQELYGKGVSNELYITHFSQAFNGMSFYDAARLCYERMGLILLAVEDKQTEVLYISPSPTAHPNLTLRASTIEDIENAMLGYFIGKDQHHVHEVSWYGASTDLRAMGGIPLVPQDLPQKRRSSVLYSMTSPSSPKSVNFAIGEFHLCDKQPMQECLVDSKGSDLCGHILLCVFADDKSSALYLRNFLEPLRRNTMAEDKLLPVTIIANNNFLEKEWPCINCFPKLTVLPGSPLDWNNLSLARVETCRVCVILTASKKGEKHEEPAMWDKEAILCSLMIHNHHKQIDSAVQPPLVITDLIEESNVQFLDIEDKDEADGRIYISQPFACGEAFAASLFDSITSSTFRSAGILFLVEQLISSSRNEHCYTQSSINFTPLSELQTAATRSSFKELYCYMLTKKKTPVAISRLVNPPPSEGGSTVTAIVPILATHHRAISSQRYIVTAPPPDTLLLPTDYVLVLEENLPIICSTIHDH